MQWDLALRPQLVSYLKDGHVAKWTTEFPLWNCGEDTFGEGANSSSGRTYNMQTWGAIFNPMAWETEEDVSEARERER